MDKFIIAPEDCLILKAFKDSKSLRDAAKILECDPAGLARKVQHISEQYGFMQKVNNRWQITGRGLDLVAWVEDSMQNQKKILSSKHSLRIATTMWLSEEVLIPNISKLNNYLGINTHFSISVPTKEFELALIDGSVDIIIACHPPETPEIEHKQVVQEKWILIAPSSWKKELNLRNNNFLEALKKLPFIRHQSMNEDLFLSQIGEISYSSLSTNNLIGIRSAVKEGLGWSLAPKLLVARQLAEGHIIELPYDVPVRDRKVCVWWLRNRHEIRAQSSKLCLWIKEICI